MVTGKNIWVTPISIPLIPIIPFKKIENNRPKTAKEKLELRKYDSGPYNQTLSDFWDDSQDKFKEQGKDMYTLTSDEVENYSESDIKKSFDI